MIATDRKRFAQIFNRLAVALRLPADEADTAMQVVYFDALGEMDIDAIDDAAQQLARSSEWFPKTSEWLAATEIAHSQRVLARTLPAPRVDPWRPECETCDDTGWENLKCDGSNQCGRERPHYAHDYVIPCTCRETNRTYQRKREQERVAARRKHGAAKHGDKVRG